MSKTFQDYKVSAEYWTKRNAPTELTYKGNKLSIQRGNFYTEVKTMEGIILGRAKTTKNAVIQAKRYLDVVIQDRAERA